MVELHTSPRIPETETVNDDQRIEIHGVTFDQYEAVRTALDHLATLKMTYREGMLEIMSPGRRHELVKKLVARLIEIYALEKGIDLTGAGSTTFRERAKERGLEPDECYSLGELKEVPDFALEVVITSGAMDKLDVYAGLGVPEVWIWEDGKFSIHRLGPKGYARTERSAFLPDLDLDVLASFVTPEKNHTEVVRAFREHFTRRRPGSSPSP